MGWTYGERGFNKWTSDTPDDKRWSELDAGITNLSLRGREPGKIKKKYMVSKKTQKKYGFVRTPEQNAELAAMIKERQEMAARGVNYTSIWKNRRAQMDADREQGNAPIRAATKAKAAPTATSALARSAARNTAAPSIKVPKELAARKAVPNVSARMKQKTANRSAGIRT